MSHGIVVVVVVVVALCLLFGCALVARVAEGKIQSRRGRGCNCGHALHSIAQKIQLAALFKEDILQAPEEEDPEMKDAMEDCRAFRSVPKVVSCSFWRSLVGKPKEISQLLI